MSPTRASLLRQRQKSYPALKPTNQTEREKKKEKKTKTRRLRKGKEPSRFGFDASTTIESRYDKIIPLLEARGAGAREFRLESGTQLKKSPKKIPWNSIGGEFDASSPASDRNRPFGEPEYKKKRKKKERKPQSNKSKNIFSDKFKKKKRRYPPKPTTKFVPFKKTRRIERLTKSHKSRRPY